jgi:hypothetical protein
VSRDLKKLLALARRVSSLPPKDLMEHHTSALSIISLDKPRLFKYWIDAMLNLRDKRGMTALMLACKRGHANIVRELCAAGARLDLKDADHKTALDYAEGNTEIIEELTRPRPRSNRKRQKTAHS